MQGTPLPVRPSLRRLPLFAGRTFVVCDDDHDVAELLSTGLEARGADVVIASTGSALLNVLRVLDIPDALGLLAPRHLTLFNITEKSFDRTAQAYHAAGYESRLSQQTLSK